MACETCSGGEVHRHAYNPNPAINDITVADDGTVLFVKPLLPSEMCVHELRNVVIELEAGYEQPDDLAPMVWNPETCRLEPGCWPSSNIIDWDSTQTLSPPTEDADGNVYCEASCEDGTTYGFRDLATGCLSHVCLGGEMVCLPTGGGTVDPGTPVDEVCYDVADWTFPASYGGNGGSWQIFGNEYNNAVCSGGPQQFQFNSKEWACFGDFGGDPGPPAGWNSLGWAPDTNPPDPQVIEAVEGVSHGTCARPAFRMDPGFPVGASGPFTWSFDFTLTSGATRFAAYDKISGNQLPVTIVSQPPGSTAVLETGPNGPQVFTNASPTGPYVFSFTLPAGVQAENVCFVVWNMGGVGEPERVETSNVTAIPSEADCCFTWNSISELTNWMNSIDPIASGWTVNGTTICQTVAAGVGANYGNLESCDDSSPPMVMTSTSTGGGDSCPTCVSIIPDGGNTGLATATQTPGTNYKIELPCSITAPGGALGSPSGHFIDACEVLPMPAGNDGPEPGFPASDFPEWWRQGFTGASTGSESWIVLRAPSGALEWHKQ